jgi:hypothetical protein
MDAYEGRQPCPTCGYKAIITYAFILLHHLQICSQSHIPKFRVCSSAFRTGRTTTWTQYTAYTVHKQEKTVALPNTMPTLFLANVIQQNQNRHLAVKFKLLQIMRPSTSVCNRGKKDEAQGNFQHQMRPFKSLLLHMFQQVRIVRKLNM